MTLVLNLNSEHIELINKVKRTLGKFSTFDSLKIYEDENKYTIITTNTSSCYMTRTIVGKIHWRVIESFYKEAGEEEKKLK